MPALPHNEVLLDSKSSRFPTLGMRVVFAILGALLAGHALRSYLALPAEPLVPLSQFFVGVVAILATGWRRSLVLTPQGLLRQTNRWGARSDTLLPWSEIRHVTLVPRRTEVTALFEREGITGIKVLFDRQDEGTLRTILKERLPEDAEIQTL